MAKLNSLRIDAKKVSNGVWCKYQDDIEFLIARKENPQFHEFMEEEIAPHLASIRAGTFDKELDKKITKKAIAHTVLLGWKGLEDDEGKPIKYSPEKALEILEDPEFSDIYKFILMMSNSQELYRRKEEALASKNL